MAYLTLYSATGSISWNLVLPISAIKNEYHSYWHTRSNCSKLFDNYCYCLCHDRDSKHRKQSGKKPYLEGLPVYNYWTSYFSDTFLVNHWVCTDPSSLSKPDFSCDDRMGSEVLGEECRKERLKRWRASPWTRPRGSWNGQCFHKTNPKLGWSVSHRLSKGWFPWKPARSLIETGKKKVKRPFCKIVIKLAYNWLKIETKRLVEGKII